MKKIIYTTDNFRLVKNGINPYTKTVSYIVERFDAWLGEWGFTCDHLTATKGALSKKEAADLIDRLKKEDMETEAWKKANGYNY